MASKNCKIGDQDFTFNEISNFIVNCPVVKIDPAIKKRIDESHRVIKNIVESDKVVYGVNTGFGKFADVRIRKGQVKDLQRRLVLSHAAGIGNPMPDDIVRLMMLLKIKINHLFFQLTRKNFLTQLAKSKI